MIYGPCITHLLRGGGAGAAGGMKNDVWPSLSIEHQLHRVYHSNYPPASRRVNGLH